ncbi:MAG: sugar ABC transporter substrate-binding protein [Treponema sp.]|jgi:ABC-type sugar transport system substrate-binding protein|nr:sugar ABC transporter substrate-binding protein [Treponema sp.]
MHILCVAVAAIAVVSGLYAGGGQDVGSGDRVKIAYIVKAMTDQFWIDMRNGAEQTAKELNADLSFQAPDKETDVERQIQMVENAIISKVDAIILSAASSQALIPAIVKANKANKANIPVILVNDTIDEAALREDGGFVETYVGIDQYKSAALAGEYAAKNLSDCKILLLCFSQGDFVIFFKIFGPPDRSWPAYALIYAVSANCAAALLLPAQRRTSYPDLPFSTGDLPCIKQPISCIRSFTVSCDGVF